MPNLKNEELREQLILDFCNALFSDETENYRIPMEPTRLDSVIIRLRTQKGNNIKAFLCTNTDILRMVSVKSNDDFMYYEITMPPSDNLLKYYFCIVWNQKIFYYTKTGVTLEKPNVALFEVRRDFQTPDWAKGAVMYQVFPDRFYNADPSNDVKTGEYSYLGEDVCKIEDWNELPSEGDYRHFYGGDLLGIQEKLDYFVELGVDVLYLNPVFVSPSNHKYDIQDYDHIDPHLGKIVVDGEGEDLYKIRVTSEENLAASDAVFAELIEKAHERNIKIIIDGVFNHCGAFHKWLDAQGIYDGIEKGALRHKDSPYRDYFYWLDEEHYESWWGHDNHPKLNMEECKTLEQEIYRIAQKWVSPPYSVDGWRLDVAADLGKDAEYNHKFWMGFREAVKLGNPDALILAEHYGDASSWLHGDQWDSVMNYDGFMEPISWFLTGVSKHSDAQRWDLYNNTEVFWRIVKHEMARLPYQALITAMNEISNHDHSRFLTRTNGKVGRLHTVGAGPASQNVQHAIMREAVIFQMSWIGCPTIYYGDEAGVTGWTDPDNRRTYPWGHEDEGLITFHQECIRIRKENIALTAGSMKPLTMEQGVLAYGRFTEDNKCIVVINNTDGEKNIELEVWQVGVPQESTLVSLITTKQNGFHLETIEYFVENGKLTLSIPPKSGTILKEVEYGVEDSI